MISSAEGTRGSLRHTTNMPSLAIDATEGYLLTSLMLVVFLEGRVPCFKWACVLDSQVVWLKSRSCGEGQAGLVVYDTLNMY